MNGITRRDALHAEKACRYAFWAMLAPMVGAKVSLGRGVEISLGVLAGVALAFACFYHLRIARRTLTKPWITVLLFLSWPVALCLGFLMDLVRQLMPGLEPPPAVQGLAGILLMAGIIASSYLLVLLFQQWLVWFKFDGSGRLVFLKRRNWELARKFTRILERLWLFAVFPFYALVVIIFVGSWSIADGDPEALNSLFGSRGKTTWDAAVFLILFLVLALANMVYYFQVVYVFSRFRGLWQGMRATLDKSPPRNEADAE